MNNLCVGTKKANVNHLSNILGENSAYLLADYTQLIPNRAESDNSEENSEIEIRTENIKLILD